MRATHRPSLLDFVAVAAACFLFTKLSLVAVVDGIAVLWLPNAVLLGALIVFEGRGRAAFVILTIAIAPIADAGRFGIAQALAFGAIGAAAALIAAAILRHRRFDPREMTIRDVASFALAGPIIAALAAAFAAVAVHRAFGGGAAAGISDIEFFRRWWAAEALGLTLLTPALLALAMRDALFRASLRRLTIWDVAAVAALVGALLFTGGGGVATGPEGGPILVLPLMIALAARATPGVMSLVAIGVALVVVTMMQSGLQPFGDASGRTMVIKAQVLLFVTTFVSQGLSAMLSQIRQKRAEVELLNDELEVRVKARTAELERALSQVRQLQGLVPICAWCKRVRDDKDFWHSVEKYIEARTHAQFSHGICPSCYDEQLKDVILDEPLAPDRRS